MYVYIYIEMPPTWLAVENPAWLSWIFPLTLDIPGYAIAFSEFSQQSESSKHHFNGLT